MRVWVFQTGEYLPFLDDGNRPMRASNVVRALLNRGHHVTLWTADFVHHDLTHRFGQNTLVRAGDNAEIRLVSSPGYRRNIGVGRLYDHAVLSANLRSALRGQVPPDVAFVGFPPVDAAAVMIHWLKRMGVPTILDVKDQWPETLLRPVPETMQPLGRVVLAPYYRLARRAIRQADVVVSISEPFLDWTLGFAGRERSERDMVVPLTVPTEVALPSETLAQAEQWWDRRGVLDDDRPKLIFVGRLTSVLDAEPLLRAASECPEWQVIVGGNGPLFERLVADTRSLPNVDVPGWLDQARSHTLHRRAAAAIVPYRQEHAFGLSIPNKALDALAHGLPILTSLSGHLADLVEGRGVGARYDQDRPLEGFLRAWGRDPSVRDTMSMRARLLYDTDFSHETVYSRLVDRLERMG